MRGNMLGFEWCWPGGYVMTTISTTNNDDHDDNDEGEDNARCLWHVRVLATVSSIV